MVSRRSSVGLKTQGGGTISRAITEEEEGDSCQKDARIMTGKKDRGGNQGKATRSRERKRGRINSSRVLFRGVGDGLEKDR